MTSVKSDEPCDGCSRRALLRGLGLAATGLVVLAGCQPGGAALGNVTACGPETCVDLADPANTPLATVGGSLLVQVGSDTVMLMRIDATTVLAVSAICTHNGCTIDYVAGDQTLRCPCHGAHFGSDGHVISGPTNRRLRQYTASLAENVITINA